MSSIHEWVEEQMQAHDLAKPFAPENGLPLRFKVGDPVIFRNAYGVEFPLTVTGYYPRPERADGLYSRGARYLLDSSSPWLPVAEASLRLDTSRAAVMQSEAAP